MDPRQPQHPFSRNTASPYGRTPFPPSSNQPFPSTHPPSAAPSYAPDHQRRPSDPSYFSQPQQRAYAQEGHQIPAQGHSRHQSASSIGTPINRNMPPPSSPQQQGPPQPQQPSHHGGYAPPPPRAPPVSVGPPSTFPSGRELPTLPLLGRPASNGSSMSISSMLGGPLASREPPPAQYASPMVTSAPAPAAIFGATHASPRITTTGVEYQTYRRPQTPEHQRNFEPRDHRANSAGSPPVMGQYATPEGRRYGTPQQGYGQRIPVGDERREPMRVPNPNAMPPRPSSQPSAFNAAPPPPPRVTESSRPPTHNEAMFARRMDGAPRAPEPLGRPDPGYGRPPFEERHDAYPYAERDRQEREAVIIREAESQAIIRLQRARAAEHENSIYAQQLAQRNAQNTYSSRPAEPRDQTPAWMRPGYDPADRRYEPAPTERAPPQQPVTTSYEYPATTTAPQFGRTGAYNHPPMPPVEHRYSQPSQPPPSSMAPQQHNLQQSAHYEREAMERQRIAQQHQDEQRLRQQQQQALDQQRQQQQQLMYGNHQNQQYQQHESPQRRPQQEEPQPMQPSRSFLGVQEINRKGRASPLPQAVQGAQGPLNVAGGEPSIKNEFGRMFSGIGISLGAMSVPSPVSASAQGTPFSNSGQLRREDLESLQDSPLENGHRLPRSASRQGGSRRRKLKEEDSRDDESSAGRRTPSGNGRGGAKRAKTGHHHAPHHHHHHRPDEHISPPQSNLTPFKSAKASAMPSPPGLEPRSTPSLHHHHVPRHHHHHHHVTPAKAAAPAHVVIPLIKPIVKNQEVINAVASIPRRNLGSTYYRSELRPGGQPTIHPKLAVGKKFKPNAGFVSTPQPLPRFEGKENCLFTIKIPPIYLTHSSREEITKRKAVWGTDIYTDDSDVIAACIHQGWFRGAWDRSIDVNLLDLEIDVGSRGEVQKPFSIEDTMTRPPPTGPIEVPEDRECHVELIIMPTLQNYSSLVRFGIKSREWGFKREGYQSVHDGMSFMIHSVKWVAVVDGQEGRTRATRSNIFAKQLDNKELEEESAWDAMLLTGNGSSSKSNGYVQDSFERGASRPGDIQDTRPWITGVNRSSPKGKEKEVAPSPTPPPPTPPPARILGPLPPPIPSPLSSPLVAPESLDDEEVTPNMAALLATSLEAERVPVRPVEPSREQHMVKPTPQQAMQIERVTERMIENANMMGTGHSLAPAPALDPIATLADLAVATSQAAVVPVPLSAPIVSPILSPLTSLAVPDAALTTETAQVDINPGVKPPQISGPVPSIFG